MDLLQNHHFSYQAEKVGLDREIIKFTLEGLFRYGRDTLYSFRSDKKVITQKKLTFKLF